MEFFPSQEQAQLLETVRTFAVDGCDGGVRRTAFESSSSHDPAFWSGMCRLGVAGIGLSEEYGGMGLGLVELALAAEALGYAAAPGPFLSHVLAGLAVSYAGSDEQKRRWLPGIASGETLATLVFADDSESSRVAIQDATLTGSLRNVQNPLEATLLLVATTDGAIAVVRGDSPEISFAVLDVADRTRRLSDVECAGAGAELLTAASPEIVTRLRAAALVLLSADAVGGASLLLELCVEYAKTREQFQGPIGRFQALKHQLAGMAVRIEPTRPLYWYAAYLHDQRSAETARIASVCKAHATDMFMQVARDAIEAHGGIGFTWRYDAQIWFKRAMFDYAYLGVPAVHRRLAAKLAAW